MNHDYYLIVDFEATCDDAGTVRPQEMEIIEFGVVMADADFHVVDEFQSFVRPQRHPKLTEFCARLTSIKQAEVDKAPTFPEVVGTFKKWLYRYNVFVFCSWGDYDLHQLRQDCQYHHVQYPISSAHVNVKRLLTQRQNLPRKPGLHEAVRLAGMEFEGQHHRGIDDAKNMARLLPYAFGEALFTDRAKRPQAYDGETVSVRQAGIEGGWYARDDTEYLNIVRTQDDILRKARRSVAKKAPR